MKLFHRKKKQKLTVPKLYESGSQDDLVRYVTEHRPLFRPQFDGWKIARNILFSLLGAAVCGVFYGYVFFLICRERPDVPLDPVRWGVIFAAIALFCILFWARKRLCAFVIHIYQAKAPDHVRLRCVYTPSCSEYMLLSIQKYGLVRGIWRGWKRLKRCHNPNGGEDWP